MGALKVNDTAVEFTSLDSVKSSLGMEPIKVMRLEAIHTDFEAAAVSDTLDFSATIPANSVLMGVSLDVKELFDDGASIASATVSLGDGSDADRFMAAVDVLTGSGSLGFVRADPADPDGAAGTDVYPQALTAATTLRLTLTLDVNCDTTTAGRVICYVHIFSPSAPNGGRDT